MKLKLSKIEISGGVVKYKEPMSIHTTYRIGGLVDYWIEPKTVKELQDTVLYLNRKGIRYRLIGNGSNVLVSSKGLPGAVINLSRMNNLTVCENQISAESGISIKDLLNSCLAHDLSGIEFMTGIPGNIGGAVWMNAGNHGGAISDYIKEIVLLRSDKIVEIKKGEFNFGYRECGLEGNDAIIRVIFELQKDTKESIKNKIAQNIHMRKLKYPSGFSAGCIFKNPVAESAGRLIELAGLKGKSVGGATVSKQHANFIINKGNASSDDILALIDYIKDIVYKKTGKKLELEIEYWV